MRQARSSRPTLPTAAAVPPTSAGAGDQLGPMVELRDVLRLAGADVVDADDVMAFGREQHRRDQGLGQLLGRDDHRPRARIAEDVLVIAGGVGGVGRHGDAAGGHDAEVGDQPFRPVLADQHHPVARLEAEPLQAVGQRRDLPRRLAPADRLPLRRRSWPTGTACRPSRRRGSGTCVTRLGKCSSCRAMRLPSRDRPLLSPICASSASVPTACVDGARRLR